MALNSTRKTFSEVYGSINEDDKFSVYGVPLFNYNPDNDVFLTYLMIAAWNDSLKIGINRGRREDAGYINWKSRNNNENPYIILDVNRVIMLIKAIDLFLKDRDANDGIGVITQRCIITFNKGTRFKLPEEKNVIRITTCAKDKMIERDALFECTNNSFINNFKIDRDTHKPKFDYLKIDTNSTNLEYIREVCKAFVLSAGGSIPYFTIKALNKEYGHKVPF